MTLKTGRGCPVVVEDRAGLPLIPIDGSYPQAKSCCNTTRITAKAWLTKLAVTRSTVPMSTTIQA